MDVGSGFAIYGNLFGWYANQQLIGFFIQTGIWLIPYYFIFYNAVWGSRADGEPFNAVSVLVKLEYHIYISLFIIALFLNPAVSVNKLNFQYNDGVEIEDGSGAGTSSYSSLATKAPDTVLVPPAWYGVIVFTNAFNGVLKTILPTGSTARQLMHQMQQLKVDDPEVQAEYEKFDANCFGPAQNNYAITMAIPESQLAQKINADIATFDGADPDPSDSWKVNNHYAGNDVFKNYFYGNTPTCGQDDPKGTGSLCMPLDTKPLTPHQAKDGLDCNTWWNGAGFFSTSLREKLTDSLNDSTSTIDLISFDTDENLYAAMARMTTTQFNDAKGLNDKSSGSEGVVQWVAEAFGGITGTVGHYISEFTTTIIRFALPILQGVIAMFIIIMLPILITFGCYSPEKTASVAITFFGLLLLPGVWHVITWLDQVVMQAIWTEDTFLNPSVSIARAAWDFVVLSCYMVFTYLWMGLVSSMGGGLSRSISQSLGGAGGSTSAATAVNSAGRFASQRLSQRKK